METFETQYQLGTAQTMARAKHESKIRENRKGQMVQIEQWQSPLYELCPSTYFGKADQFLNKQKRYWSFQIRRTASSALIPICRSLGAYSMQKQSSYRRNTGRELFHVCERYPFILALELKPEMLQSRGLCLAKTEIENKASFNRFSLSS